MDITVTIPDANVDRVAAAVNNGPGSHGEEVTADNLAEVLSAQWTEGLRQTVQGHEASQAATAAARAVADTPDPLSDDDKVTFAAAAEAVAEARAVKAEALAETRAVEALSLEEDAK